VTHYRFRKRDSPLLIPGWWYLDILAGEKGMTHLGPEKVLETYEIGEPVQPKFDLPNLKQAFVFIDEFKEDRGRGYIMARIPGDPTRVRLNINEIEKLPPLIRLAAEAFV
jgi:hypothetical protein